MTDGAHKASVTIDAKVDAADRDIKKLTRRINGMEKQLSRSDKAARRNAEAMKTIGRVSVVAASASVCAGVGLFRLAEASAETANKTAKASKALSVASGGLQKLEFAASRATTATSEQLHKGIAALTVGLEDAVVKGTGPVAEGLDAIGLSVNSLVGLDIEDQFGVIADAMAKVPTEALKSAASMKLFGRRAGVELKPLLDEGSAGLRAYGEEATRLGLVLDRNALAASEDFIDSLSDMKQTVAAVARDVGIAAIPAFKDAADGVKEWAVENQELIDQNVPKLVEQITTGMLALAAATLAVSGALSDVRDGFHSIQDFIRKNPLGGNPTLTEDEKRQQRLDRRLAGSRATPGEFVPVRRVIGADGTVVEFETPTDTGGGGPSDAAISAAEKARLDAQRRIESHNRQAKAIAAADKRRGGRRGGRGKRDQKSLLETMLERDLTSFSDNEPDLSFLDSGLVDPFSAENRQIGLDEKARMIEEERAIENVRRQGLLEDELAHLEMRREMGADPFELIDRETQARLEFNDFMLSQADSEAQRLQVQNDRRQIAHNAEMKRLKVEQQQQQQRMQVYAQVGQGIDTVYRATAEAALASALSQEGSVRQAVQGTAKAEALRSTITAGSALVQALFWSAVPGGQATAAQFFTASGVAAAKAVAFGTLAGSLSGGGGGGGSSPGVLTGSSFGAAGGARGSQGQAALPPAPGAGSSVPGSPTRRPGTDVGDPATGSQSSSGPNFNGAVFHMYGTPHEDFIESVTRGQGQLRLNRRS